MSDSVVPIQIYNSACLNGIQFRLEYCGILPKAKEKLLPCALILRPSQRSFIYLGDMYTRFLLIGLKSVYPFTSVRESDCESFVIDVSIILSDLDFQ